MLETREHFGRRLTLLGRKHRAMADGYTTSIRKDGLIIVKPKRRSRGLPVKGLVLTLLGFFAFKAFVVISMGDLTYSERVATLASGTPVEQAGAWAMQIDPVTLAMITAYTEVMK